MSDLGIGVREFDNPASSITSQLISSNNLRQAKKNDSRVAAIHKILVKYAETINLQDKIRIIQEFGDGSKITSNSENYINNLFADTLMSTMPQEDLDILIRDIRIKEDKLVKKIKGINNRKVTDFNFNRFASQLTKKKSAATQRYKSSRMIGKSVLGSLFSMMGYKGGLGAFRKEVKKLLNSLQPQYVSWLGTQIGIDIEEQRYSLKQLILDITNRVAAYYDWAQGKLKKLPFAITTAAGKAFEEIIQGTSYRNVLGVAFLEDKELKAIKNRYKNINKRNVKSKLKEKEKLEKTRISATKSKKKQTKSEVSELAKTDTEKFNYLVDTFGARRNGLFAGLRTKRALRQQLLKENTFFRKNPNTILDKSQTLTGQFYEGEEEKKEEPTVVVTGGDEGSTRGSSGEKGAGFSLMGTFKTIYSKDSGMIHSAFKAKGINRIVKMPAIPVVMVNGMLRASKGKGKNKEKDAAELELQSANIMYSTYELLNENLPKIASSSGWIPQNLPILWGGLQSVMGTNGAAAAAIAVGAKSGLENIMQDMAASMGLDLNAKDPDLSDTDNFLKAYKSKIKSYDAFATGGFGKAPKQISQFISGDSLNSKPNPEAVSIDWKRKTFSVKPIPVEAGSKFATGGEKAVGEAPTRMSAAERSAPLSVSISSSKIKYSKKLTDVEDDGTNEAIKVYAVNPWFNDKVAVGDTEMSMLEILAGIFSNVSAIAGTTASSNALLTGIASNTAVSAKNSKTSGSGGNPFVGGYPTSMNNILQGV